MLHSLSVLDLISKIQSETLGGGGEGGENPGGDLDGDT